MITFKSIYDGKEHSTNGYEQYARKFKKKTLVLKTEYMNLYFFIKLIEVISILYNMKRKLTVYKLKIFTINRRSEISYF